MSFFSAPKHGISMRTIGSFALLLVALYAVLASAYSVRFLNKIEESARITREQQIPLILSQNRNALKVERATSLIRSVYLARDRKIERQIQLQLQTLCQSFTLDDNQMLTDGAREIAAEVKRMVSSRETVRKLRAAAEAAPGTVNEDDIKAAEADGAAAYQHAVRTADRLSDSLSTDAIVLADSLASSVASAAKEVKVGWILILTLPVLFLVTTLWVIGRYVMAPIGSAIAKLEAIGRGAEETGRLRQPIFQELATIADAVDSYGALSQDLKRTNEMLQILSDKDGLTGISNRRVLESDLQTTFSVARSQNADLSILMIDLDHFKSINDTYGHKGGDICLRTVSDILQRLAREENIHVGRYGGEEFMAIVPGRDQVKVHGLAERLRKAVEAAAVDAGSGRIVRLTTSIGVSSLNGRTLEEVGILVSEADEALYLAKRTGRNRVCHADGAVVRTAAAG